jgi:hypothetical protein
VNVLFTIGVIAAVLLWTFAVIRRLDRMRQEVKLAWQKLESDQSNEAIKTVYNKHVAQYNAALEAFPAYLVGPIAGFKPAKRF